MEAMGSNKNESGICDVHPILGQFRNKSEYAQFAENSLKGVLERRGPLDEAMLLEL